MSAGFTPGRLRLCTISRLMSAMGTGWSMERGGILPMLRAQRTDCTPLPDGGAAGAGPAAPSTPGSFRPHRPVAAVARSGLDHLPGAHAELVQAGHVARQVRVAGELGEQHDD